MTLSTPPARNLPRDQYIPPDSAMSCRITTLMQLGGFSLLAVRTAKARIPGASVSATSFGEAA